MTHPASDPLDHADLIAEDLRALDLLLDSYDVQLDVSRPSPARRYDYLLGGKDNFAADRESADHLKQALPNIGLAAAELRRCMQRQVAYLAHRGIRQFLDIGCGMPHHPDVHAIAQTIDPTCKVVYVDNDELVGVHARALLIGTDQGAIGVLDGDLSDTDTILNARTVRDILDFDQPIAVLLLAVLPYIIDDQQARTAVEKIKTALTPGSYLAITHLTDDPLPAAKAGELTALTTSLDHGAFTTRSRHQIAGFLDRLDLVKPGLVSTVEWQPDRSPKPCATAEQALAYAAIGRLP